MLLCLFLFVTCQHSDIRTCRNLRITGITLKYPFPGLSINLNLNLLTFCIFKLVSGAVSRTWQGDEILPLPWEKSFKLPSFDLDVPWDIKNCFVISCLGLKY